MLSRIVKRTVTAPWLRPLAARTATSSAAASDERDLVNFPRRSRPINKPAVRFNWIPEELFQFFYPKTGVTGPYIFVGTVTTFLVSKEIWVLEHEFYSGLAVLAVLAGINKVAGTDITNWVNKGLDEEEGKLKAIRQDEIDRCKEAISAEENAQWMATSYETLIEVKKENVALQMEAAYRERLQEAFLQVKRRLDYQLEVSNVMRRLEQRHMVDWIVNNVRKAITPKQEDDALKKCLVDLKSLA